MTQIIFNNKIFLVFLKIVVDKNYLRECAACTELVSSGVLSIQEAIRSIGIIEFEYTCFTPFHSEKKARDRQRNALEFPVGISGEKPVPITSILEGKSTKAKPEK